MEERVDVVVIGGGAMGSAAAWQLARRGREVVLLDRFGSGHLAGASHGSRRNFNVAYTEPEYLELLVESARAWRELETETGAELLHLGGLVDHGAAALLDDVDAALTAAGIPSSFLPLEEAAERWPGIRFDTRVLFYPDAGTIRAEDAVRALRQAATALGADARDGQRVTNLAVADDEVLVEVEAAETRSRLRARRVVVTAGAWTNRLLRRRVRLPRLTVTHEQPAHFATRDDALAWPSFNHRRGAGRRYGYWPATVYGLLDPGEGLKVGWHRAGPIIDPDAPVRRSDPRTLARLRRYAGDWLPGVDPDRSTVISCTYTSTADSHFVVDRIGPVVVGAGFSGHGFKFTPAIGRLLADLATDARPAPALFRSTR